MAQFNTLNGLFFSPPVSKTPPVAAGGAGSARSERRFIKLQNLTQISVNPEEEMKI